MQIEMRSQGAVIRGYVNAVGRDSRVMEFPGGRFVEQVCPKTFERALQEGTPVELRFNHSKRLGSTEEGNLKLTEDNIGLYAEAEVTDPEVVEKARKGELRGWSFAFVKKKQRWESTAQEGIQRRYLEDIHLQEVSLLDKTPAYQGTSIEMRQDETLERRELDTPPHISFVRECESDSSGPEKGRPVISLEEKKKEIERLRMKGRLL